MISRARYQRMLLILLAGIIVFHITTIRQGHTWMSDFAVYIEHAKNLVDGKPYAATAWIRDTQTSHPTSYPPGFPLALAPVYAVFGLNVYAMKLVGILFFGVALFVLARLFQKGTLPPFYILVCLTFIGFNPFFWEQTNKIGPNFLLMACTYTSLLILHKAYAARAKSERYTGWALLAVACMYLATLTHILGVALLLSLLLYELLRFRRLTRVGLLVAGTFLLLFILQAFLFLSSDTGGLQATLQGEGYFKLIKNNLFNDVSNPLSTGKKYLGRINAYWDNGYVRAVAYLTSIGLASLALVGFYHHLRNRFSAQDVFVVVYLLALLPWSFASSSYLLLIMPLVFYYVLVGVVDVQQRFRWKRPVLLAASVAVLLTTYGAKYTTVDFETSERNALTPAAQGLFEFIAAHTQPDEVFIFSMPRQLAPLVDRRMSRYPYGSISDRALLQFFDSLGVAYVLDGPAELHRHRMRRLADAHADRFELMYKNKEFELYRLRPHPAQERR